MRKKVWKTDCADVFKAASSHRSDNARLTISQNRPPNSLNILRTPQWNFLLTFIHGIFCNYGVLSSKKAICYAYTTILNSYYHMIVFNNLRKKLVQEHFQTMIMFTCKRQQFTSEKIFRLFWVFIEQQWPSEWSSQRTTTWWRIVRRNPNQYNLNNIWRAWSVSNSHTSHVRIYYCDSSLESTHFITF